MPTSSRLHLLDGPVVSETPGARSPLAVMLDVGRAENDNEVCRLVGTQALALNPGARVFVSLYDPARQRLRVRCVLGLGKLTARVAALLQRTPEHLESAVEDIPPDAAALSTSGRMEAYPLSLLRVLTQHLPAAVTDTLQGLLDLDRICGVGFALDGHPYGGLMIAPRRGRPVLGTQELEALVAMAGAVVKRLHLEAALQESQERFRSLFERSRDAIYTHDLAGRFLDANPAALELVGATAEDVGNHSIADIVHPDDLARARAATAELVATGRSTPQVYRVRYPDGREVLAECRGVALYRQGKPYAVQCIGRDITGRNQDEQQRLQHAKVESLGLLAGGIAHDFNNVLAAVDGSLQLALAACTDPVQREDLVAAAEASRRAASITKQLLTFAKGGAPVTCSCALDPLVRSAAELSVRGSPVRCALHLGATRPVRADAGLMAQVVRHLVLNAREAMPGGGVVTVRTADAEEDGRPGVLLEVQDRGPGVDPADLPHLFDPYFTTKLGHSGLGLAVAHSVVRQHGGSVRVERGDGVGTTFRLWLPADAQPPQPARTGHGPVPPSRVLVMDDDAMVQRVLARMIQQAGHTVCVTSRGEDALREYALSRDAGTPFDAVVLDLTVPHGMGGRETAARLLELDPATRLVVASGYSDDAVMATPDRFGFQAALVKPFDQEQLDAVLAQVLAPAEPERGALLPAGRSARRPGPQ